MIGMTNEPHAWAVIHKTTLWTIFEERNKDAAPHARPRRSAAQILQKIDLPTYLPTGPASGRRNLPDLPTYLPTGPASGWRNLPTYLFIMPDQSYVG